MVLRAKTARRKAPTPIHPALTGPLRALELAFQEAELRAVETYRRGAPVPARPTLVEHGPLRLLVSATPSPSSLEAYADTLVCHNVKHVVRVCEPTYDAEDLRRLGFNVHEWPFPDGESPPQSVLDKWFALLDTVFNTSAYKHRPDPDSDAASSDSDFSPLGSPDQSGETIAVHCVAGLGRAPVLAALALVDIGLAPYEAVGWMRALRRGAINARQLAFVEEFAVRPPPMPVKPSHKKTRSGSFVGALWPSLKAFRPRSPRSSRDGAATNTGAGSPRSAGRFASCPYLPPRIADI